MLEPLVVEDPDFSKRSLSNLSQEGGQFLIAVSKY
jgi:hypothetical protein